MYIKKQLLINMYGQSIVSIDKLIEVFRKEKDKKLFLEEFIFLILQSKPLITDVDYIIENSGLAQTCTPCVMIRKDLKEYNLRKMIKLPDYELEKVFILFLELFKVSYNRCFLKEQNNPNKWWYWDLTNRNKIKEILIMHNVFV